VTYQSQLVVNEVCRSQLELVLGSGNTGGVEPDRTSIHKHALNE